MQDKITALAAPPGNSLTGPPGKWAWEQPARFSNPDDAIAHITESIGNGPARNDMLKLMLAGITVEELVDQVAFKGFMAGAFTPDVAELIKPAIGVFLYAMGIQEGIPVQMFVDEEESQGNVDDVAFYNIIKSRNPQLFMAMNEERNRMTRMGEKFDVSYETQDAPPENSFLSTPPVSEETE